MFSLALYLDSSIKRYISIVEEHSISQGRWNERPGMMGSFPPLIEGEVY